MVVGRHSFGNSGNGEGNFVLFGGEERSCTCYAVDIFQVLALVEEVSCISFKSQ
jgi:hypothetical protein